MTACAKMQAMPPITLEMLEPLACLVVAGMVIAVASAVIDVIRGKAPPRDRDGPDDW